MWSSRRRRPSGRRCRRRRRRRTSGRRPGTRRRAPTSARSRRGSSSIRSALARSQRRHVADVTPLRAARRPRRPRRGPGGARRSRRPARRPRRRPAGRGRAARPAPPARRARPSRACASTSRPSGGAAASAWCRRSPSARGRCDCTMPLAAARIHHCSMSSVMPRSWPTTIPGVTTSTRAAPVGEQLGDGRGVVEADLVDHDDDAGRLGRAGRARRATSQTLRRRRRRPTTGAAATAPVATTTWSGRRAAIDVDRRLDAVLDRHARAGGTR